MWDEEDAFSNLTKVPSSSGNMTLTCIARSLDHPHALPFSPSLTATVRVVLTICYLLIIASALFLNIMVIVLAAKYKKLRTRSIIIVLQIVVCNIGVTSTVYLLRPMTLTADQWLFGEYICIVTGYLYLTYLLVRTLLMFAFVVDRFLSVFFLLSYPKHSSKIMIPLCAFTWVFAIVVRGIGFPGILDCYVFRLSAYSCIHSSGCSTACATVARISIGLIFGPATAIPVILYAMLYFKARQLMKKLAAFALTASVGGTRVPPNDLYRKELKPTITFFLLLVSAFVLTTPTIVVAVIATTLARTMGPLPILYVISAVSSTLTACLVVVDPIVILKSIYD